MLPRGDRRTLGVALRATVRGGVLLLVVLGQSEVARQEPRAAADWSTPAVWLGRWCSRVSTSGYWSSSRRSKSWRERGQTTNFACLDAQEGAWIHGPAGPAGPARAQSGALWKALGEARRLSSPRTEALADPRTEAGRGRTWGSGGGGWSWAGVVFAAAVGGGGQWGRPVPLAIQAPDRGG